MVKDYWFSLSTIGRILLIVTLALCALWLAGMEPRIFDTTDGLNTFILYNGRFELRHRSRVDATYMTAVDVGPKHEFLGTGAFSTLTIHGGHVDTIDFTYWPFILLSAIIPTRSFLRFRRRLERNRRIEAGHCAACGYDVRGFDDRCPECGEPIPTPACESLAKRSPDRRVEKPSVNGYWRSLSTIGRMLLVITLALCGLWLAGMEPRGGTTADGLNSVLLYGGRISWKHRSRRDADYFDGVGSGPGFEFLRTGAYRIFTINGGHIDTVDLTLWPFILLSAIVPFRSFLRLRRMLKRKQRIEAGHCGVCGYDVRGVKDRCPECGQSIPGPKSDELAPRSPRSQEDESK